MSGTIPLSMTQQFDRYGNLLTGGQLYFIQAGTVATPQNAFQDAALAIPLPNPVTLDAAGRIPQFFLADGQIKIRLQDKNGLVQLAADNVLVIGPSAGGGGGGSVDPTTVMQTGDLKARYDTAIIAGFVRLNGKTVGSATSGAGELADPSAQALFQFLWNTDPNLSVGNPPNNAVPGSGRGSSAISDWNANKQITLPDWRGCSISGLDDMGNALAGRLSAAFFGSSPIVLGAAGGSESTVLTTLQLPNHTPTGTAASSQGDANLPAPVSIYSAVGGSNVNRFVQANSGMASNGNMNVPVNEAPITTTITMNSIGGGQAHRTIGPRKLCTIYIKL